jgi:hypothetical protein
MDKQRKKELKKEYLRQELLKETKGDNEILANWAKIKLGIPLSKLDKTALEELADDELEEKICYKINEKLSETKKLNRHKDELLIIEELPKDLKLVLYSFYLDMNIEDSGFEDYYVNTAGLHIIDTIQTLRILNYPEIIELLEKSVGVFLFFIESGFNFWSGEIAKWSEKSETIDKIYYQHQAENCDFAQLDREYNAIKQEFKQLRIRYIRNNILKYQL